MKRFIIAILAVVMVFAFASCSKGSSSSTPAPAATSTTASAPAAQVATAPATTAATQTTTPSTGTVDTEYDPNKTVDYVQRTNESNRVIIEGTIDKSLYQTPIFVTSFGQSTDAAMLDTVMKKLNGVEYVYNATARAEALSGAKTVVIAVGASTKGLGAAGISEADETARAKEIMQYIKDHDLEVICCHIGGSARRGALSDEYTNMVLDVASLIVLKEDANFDYKFTNFAEEHNVPIALVYATKDTVAAFQEVFN